MAVCIAEEEYLWFSRRRPYRENSLLIECIKTNSIYCNSKSEKKTRRIEKLIINKTIEFESVVMSGLRVYLVRSLNNSLETNTKQTGFIHTIKAHRLRKHEA